MKKDGPADKERAHEPMAELDEVIDLIAMLGSIRRHAEQLVNQSQIWLIIPVKIFLG